MISAEKTENLCSLSAPLLSPSPSVVWLPVSPTSRISFLCHSSDAFEVAAILAVLLAPLGIFLLRSALSSSTAQVEYSRCT